MLLSCVGVESVASLSEGDVESFHTFIQIYKQLHDWGWEKKEREGERSQFIGGEMFVGCVVCDYSYSVISFSHKFTSPWMREDTGISGVNCSGDCHETTKLKKRGKNRIKFVIIEFVREYNGWWEKDSRKYRKGI